MHDHLKVVIIVLVVVLTVGIYLLCRCDSSSSEGYEDGHSTSLTSGKVGYPTWPPPIAEGGYHHYPVSPQEYADLLS